MRVIHSIEVFVGAEQHYAVVMGDISFHSLEALYTVVESGVSWVQFKRLIGLDDGGLPSSIVDIIIYLQHIVG